MTDLERLIDVSEGEGPSPEFVAALRQRVLAEAAKRPEPKNGAMVIDLNDPRRNKNDPENRTWGTTRLILAAAAVVLVVGVAAVVAVQNSRGSEIIEPTETTVPNEIEPDPTTIEPPETPEPVFQRGATRLDSREVALDTGTYRVDEVGTPFTFAIDAELTDSFALVFNYDGRTTIADPQSAGAADRDIVFTRVSTFVDPRDARSVPGEGNEGWPANDAAGWLDNLDDPYIVSDRQQTTLGGRPAIRFDLRLVDDACDQPADFCVFLSGNHETQPRQIKSGSVYRVWIVDQGDADPVLVSVGVDTTADVGWFATAEQLLQTVAFGEPGLSPGIALAEGTTKLPFLDGIRIETPPAASAVRRQGNDAHGQILLDDWAASTEFVTNPRSLDGTLLAGTDALVGHLGVLDIDVTELDSDTVGGFDARVLEFAGSILEPGFALDAEGSVVWRQSRRSRLWVVEHPDRGLLVISAEAFENADFSFPAAIEQTEALLSTLEFVEPDE